jgi:hypothetical protein
MIASMFFRCCQDGERLAIPLFVGFAKNAIPVFWDMQAALHVERIFFCSRIRGNPRQSRCAREFSVRYFNVYRRLSRELHVMDEFFCLQLVHSRCTPAVRLRKPVEIKPK